MTQESADGRDDATVLVTKQTSASVQVPPAATAVNHTTGGAASISTGGLGGSQRTRSMMAPEEKPRSIVLAVGAGALTGLALFAITALWLLRGH